MAQRVRFDGEGRSFQRDLRTRVDAYFDSTGRSRHADALVVAKGLGWASIVAAVYVGILTGALPGVLVLALGFAIAQVGFNVGHEAIHRATSSRAWVNVVLGWSFDLFGGSSYGWSRAHNLVHHTFTNMPGIDRDIDAEPWMHFHAHSRVSRYYRLQHVFAFAYYTLTMLAWIFAKDFVALARREGPVTRGERVGWVGMFFGKLVHFTAFVGVPMAVYPGAWWQVILGYVFMQMAVGFTLALVFQLAHVVEGTEFPEAAEDGIVRRSWAEHQLYTTTNFSTGGALATFFTGGLNHQIEHHLFPTVSHAHYGALSKIVRLTAAEHGLPYLENVNFLAAVRSHMRTLRRFGRDAMPAPA